jgi:hypothetical protein
MSSEYYFYHNLYNYLFDSFISCLTNLFSCLGEVSFDGGAGAVLTS